MTDLPERPPSRLPTPQRNAVEVFLLFLVIWTSVHAAFLRPQPLSVDLLLGRGWAIVWAVGLFGGGITTLIGMFWRGKPLTSLSLQQIGYGALVPMMLARTAALVGVGRIDEAFVLPVFAAACFVRILQLEYRIGGHRRTNGLMLFPMPRWWRHE